MPRASSAQPRCPYCNAAGLKNIDSVSQGQAVVIFCGQCGAIHGVAPLSAPQPAKNPTPSKAKPQNPPSPKPSSDGQPAEPIPQPDLLPLPTFTKRPAPVDPKPSPRVSQPNRKLENFLAAIGEADFEAKRAEVAQEKRRRAFAVRRGSTNYMRIAWDDGSPYCITCKVDMIPLIIPPGHKHTGQQVWVCPELCGVWEPA